jgi:hypothetical protein
MGHRYPARRPPRAGTCNIGTLDARTLGASSTPFPGPRAPRRGCQRPITVESLRQGSLVPQQGSRRPSTPTPNQHQSAPGPRSTGRQTSGLSSPHGRHPPPNLGVRAPSPRDMQPESAGVFDASLRGRHARAAGLGRPTLHHLRAFPCVISGEFADSVTGASKPDLSGLQRQRLGVYGGFKPANPEKSPKSPPASHEDLRSNGRRRRAQRGLQPTPILGHRPPS